MSRGSIFLDQGIWVSLSHSWLLLLIVTESEFVSKCYIKYPAVRKFHALSQQLDFRLFYAALLLIFLDFLHSDLLQK